MRRAVLGLEIERDRALAAIARMIIGGGHLLAVRAFDERRSPAARVVARAGALDLDHVGAEVGEDLPRPRPGQNARKLKNADTGKRSRHDETPWGYCTRKRATRRFVYLNAQSRSIGQGDLAVRDRDRTAHDVLGEIHVGEADAPVDIRAPRRRDARRPRCRCSTRRSSPRR